MTNSEIKMTNSGTKMTNSETKMGYSETKMGYYQNPIIYADYSDPDAIRVGDDYYMIASSFSNTPGLPILHSKDLVNWKLVNYALKNIPDFKYQSPMHGCGVWAPSIRYNEGKFYICFPMPDEGIYMTTASDPYGEWSPAVCIRPGAGWIDPCPFFDDDGRVYLVAGVAKSRIGYKSVLNMVELSPDAMHIIGPERRIFDGDSCGQVTCEGPKLYKRNGYYYIFAPAGGVKMGWQLVLRSKNIYGPYEQKIVLRQADTCVNGPHQGALVDTQTGESWFLHFQDVFAAGRIVHLQPVCWKEDWPIIGQPLEGEDYGKPVMSYRMPDIGQSQEEDLNQPTYAKTGLDTDDNFEDGKYGLMWQWNANHRDDWIISNDEVEKEAVKEAVNEVVNGAGNEAENEAGNETNNGLKLRPVKVVDIRPVGDYSNILMQKWPAGQFDSFIEFDLSHLKAHGIFGLISFGMKYDALEFERLEDQSIRLTHVHGEQTFDAGRAYTKEDRKVLESLKLDKDKFYARYAVRRVDTVSREVDGIMVEPVYVEEASFEIMDDEHERKIASIKFEPVAGRWVGVKSGFYTVSKKGGDCGYAKVESVSYTIKND